MEILKKHSRVTREDAALIGILAAGITVWLMVIAFFVLGILSPFVFEATDFYSRCSDVQIGDSRSEVEQNMGEYLHDPDYEIDIDGPGYYGGSWNITFDEIFSIALLNEPWYKLDQHPWACEIFYKDNVVVDTRVIYD